MDSAFMTDILQSIIESLEKERELEIREFEIVADLIYTHIIALREED